MATVTSLMYMFKSTFSFIFPSSLKRRKWMRFYFHFHIWMESENNGRYTDLQSSSCDMNGPFKETRLAYISVCVPCCRWPDSWSSWIGVPTCRSANTALSRSLHPTKQSLAITWVKLYWTRYTLFRYSIYVYIQNKQQNKVQDSITTLPKLASLQPSVRATTS